MAVLLAAGAACSLPFDDIGFTGGSGGAGAGGGAGSPTTASSMTTQQQSTSPSTVTGFGGADCASGNDVCVPPVPAGWTGPVLLADDDTQSCASPALTGGLAADATIPDTALAVEPLPCICSCALDPSSCSVTIAPDGCQGNANFTVDGASGCNNSSFAGGSNVVKLLGNLNGTCLPSATEGATSVTLAAVRDACPVEITGAGCNDDFLCVPSSEADVCVYVSGIADCANATGYPSRRTIVTSWNDSRMCTPAGCSCQTGVGACSGQVTFYDGSMCSGAEIGGPFSIDAGCPQVTGNIASASYTLDNPSFPCAPIGAGTPAGVAAADVATAFTLCCL